MKERAFMSWSGGKDSALSLYLAQQAGLRIDSLLTSVNKSLDRVSMHGVRRRLLEAQANALSLPLHTLELSENPGMEEYETALRQRHQSLKTEGYTDGVFGDIFLEDLKAYREALLAKDELRCVFPIWKMDSKDVVQKFLAEGFKAIVVCVNAAHLDQSFCGRLMDERFFADLPKGVDPCGEHGEYHSYVFDGPNFSKPIAFEKGEIVFREYPAPKTSDECFATPKPANGFYFCDLLPA